MPTSACMLCSRVSTFSCSLIIFPTAPWQLLQRTASLPHSSSNGKGASFSSTFFNAAQLAPCNFFFAFCDMLAAPQDKDSKRYPTLHCCHAKLRRITAHLMTFYDALPLLSTTLLSPLVHGSFTILLSQNNRLACETNS